MPPASWPRCCSACRPRATKLAASCDADHAEDAALLVQLVVVEGSCHAGGRLSGTALRGYIEAPPGNVISASSVLRPQLCVSRSYCPAIHCGASSGSMAWMRASRSAKIATLRLLSIWSTPPASPKTRVVDDEGDHHEEHAARDAEEKAEALVDRPDGRVLHRPGEERREDRDEDQRDHEDGGEAGEDAELAVGAEQVAQHRHLAHQRLDHRREGEAGQRRRDPADDRERFAHEAAGVGQDGGQRR